MFIVKKKKNTGTHTNNCSYPLILLFQNRLLNDQLTFKAFLLSKYMKIRLFFSFQTEPTGMLDVWYMKRHIDYSRQQISLFWKVSFKCQLKTQGSNISFKAEKDLFA